MSDLTIRPALLAFAREMETALRRNEHKPDWATVPLQDLVDKLAEERGELDRELRTADEVPGSAFRVQVEAVDEANCCFFAWDRARGPLASTNRGRN